MQENISKWVDNLVPWLLNHGIKIVFIAILAYLMNVIIGRIIVRTVRIAVVRDDNMSVEAEIKREDTLIHIFKGALR